MDFVRTDLNGFQEEWLRCRREERDKALQKDRKRLAQARKPNKVDQALGLGFGADYCLTKPFHITVLIQAAKALIRRSRVYNRSEASKLRLGPFSVDTLKMERLKNGRPLNFMGRELALVRFLMENPGQVFTKEQLYSHVWHDFIVDDNTVTVYVKRIHEKIEDDPRNPRFLKTVRGIGYKLEADT